ncbi:MAG: VWA domain-containing protein [Terriglobales bacterium]
MRTLTLPFCAERRHCLAKFLIAVVFAALFFLPLNRVHAQDETPVFRGSSRLVTLDVVVTDKAGQPVRNVSRDDFTILEDGATQTITTFEPPAAQITKSRVGKEETSTEAARAPSLTIIVLDELNSEITDQAYARQEIQKFLAAHGPVLGQPTSLMILGQKRLDLLQDYTQDPHALIQSLHRRHAELPFSLMHAEFTGVAERMSKTLWALGQIAAANNQFAGRKNVVWVGPGFPVINISLNIEPKDRQRFANAVGDTANLLFDARVAVYTVNPRGLEAFTPWDDSFEGELVFESIAPETGGRIFRNRNDLDALIALSSEEGAASYALAYYPTNRDWNGKFRNIRVVVRNPGLQVLARKGYFAVEDTPPSDEHIDRVLSRAVMSPLTYRSLEVQASYVPEGRDSGRFNIEIARRGLDWQLSTNGKRRSEVTVVTASLDARDRVITHRVKVLEILVDDKNFENQWDKPVSFYVPSSLPAGAKYVRVVVQDAENSHIGTTDLPRAALQVR